MTDRTDLARELDAWSTAGRTADLWWRDDDAQTPSPALDRLLGLAAEHEVPLALAVIPHGAGAPLADRLGAEPGIAVVQHGYAHRNYAAPEAKKIELGGERPAEIVVAELAVGWDHLQTLFGKRLLPVLVPPWNRIAPHLVPMLPELGYRGLSTFGVRTRAAPVARLGQVNAHVDVIDWRGTRGFVGEARALDDLVAHLRARRIRDADPEEATGLLTHHLDHDEATFAFLDALFRATVGHPAVRWRSAETLFGDAPVATARPA